MKKGTAAGLREELKRQRRRQVKLLSRLSAQFAVMAMVVGTKQINGISTLSDAGVLMGIGETLMANLTLEGIMGTFERIAKAATPGAEAEAEAGDIPAPGTETRQ